MEDAINEMIGEGSDASPSLEPDNNVPTPDPQHDDTPPSPDRQMVSYEGFSEKRKRDIDSPQGSRSASPDSAHEDSTAMYANALDQIFPMFPQDDNAEVCDTRVIQARDERIEELEAEVEKQTRLKERHLMFAERQYHTIEVKKIGRASCRERVF